MQTATLGQETGGTLRVSFDKDNVGFVMYPDRALIEPLIERAQEFTQQRGVDAAGLSELLLELLGNAVAVAHGNGIARSIFCTVRLLNVTLLRVTVRHAHGVPGTVERFSRPVKAPHDLGQKLCAITGGHCFSVMTNEDGTSVTAYMRVNI